MIDKIKFAKNIKTEYDEKVKCISNYKHQCHQPNIILPANINTSFTQRIHGAQRFKTKFHSQLNRVIDHRKSKTRINPKAV